MNPLCLFVIFFLQLISGYDCRSISVVVKHRHTFSVRENREPSFIHLPKSFEEELKFEHNTAGNQYKISDKDDGTEPWDKQLEDEYSGGLVDMFNSNEDDNNDEYADDDDNDEENQVSDMINGYGTEQRNEEDDNDDDDDDEEENQVNDTNNGYGTEHRNEDDDDVDDYINDGTQDRDESDKNKINSSSINDETDAEVKDDQVDKVNKSFGRTDVNPGDVADSSEQTEIKHGELINAWMDKDNEIIGRTNTVDNVNLGDRNDNYKQTEIKHSELNERNADMVDINTKRPSLEISSDITKEEAEINGVYKLMERKKRAAREQWRNSLHRNKNDEKEVPKEVWQDVTDEELNTVQKQQYIRLAKYICWTLLSVAFFVLVGICFLRDPISCIFSFGTGCPCFFIICPCVRAFIKKHLDVKKMVRDALNKYTPGVIMNDDGSLQHYEPTPDEVALLKELLDELSGQTVA